MGVQYKNNRKKVQIYMYLQVCMCMRKKFIKKRRSKQKPK